jgi:hypothetical protein
VSACHLAIKSLRPPFGDLQHPRQYAKGRDGVPFLDRGKRTPDLSEKNLWFVDYFWLAVFFFGEIVFKWGGFERRATQIDPLQVSVDGPNIVRFVSF